MKLLIIAFCLLVTGTVFAADVCVWIAPDNSVRVTHLNPKHRQQGETDGDFAKRLCNEVIIKDPSLKALKLMIVPATNLPADKSMRKAWRASGDKVVVDPTVTIK